MTRLKELDEARIAAKRVADELALMNIRNIGPDDPVRQSMTNPEYQTAMDAWYRAELDYKAERQKLNYLGGIFPSHST